MDTDSSHRVELDELTSGDWWALSWGFFWRSILFSIGSTIVGGVAGGIFGVVAGVIATVTDTPIDEHGLALQVGGAVSGMAVGFLLLRFLIKWLLRSKFGDLSLVLHRAR